MPRVAPVIKTTLPFMLIKGSPIDFL
jgi:hypothetical protein